MDTPIHIPIPLERILVIRLRALGDVLLATPAIRALREAHPDAHLAMMVRKNMAGVVEGNPHLDEVIICDPWYGESWSSMRKASEFLRGVRRLRRSRFDLVIDLFGNPRSAWLTLLSGAPYRLGYDVRGRRLAYNLHKERDLQRGVPRSEVDVHLDMVRLLGVDTKDRHLVFRMGEEHREKVRLFLQNRGIAETDEWVALTPAAKWQAKRWKPEFYGRLARLLAEEGIRVVVLWGPGERKLAEDVAEAGGDLASVAPETDLKELGALVEASSMLIGTDSGVTHLADAVDTPSVVIYGPTDPRVWHAENTERHVALRADELDCLVCNRKQCETHECMEHLTPERVMDTVTRLRARLAGERASG